MWRSSLRGDGLARTIPCVVPDSSGKTPSTCRTIAVVGGTGGCGATTIAFHLARAFARNTTTCVIEGASDAGCAERMALDRAALKTWDGAATPGELRLSALPMKGGFRAAFAPASGSIDDATVGVFTQLFETLVVEAPPAGSLPTPTISLLVVAASAPGARRARAFVEGADAIIINRTGAGGLATRRYLEARLGARAALELPHCPSLRDAEDEGRLLREGATWSRRLRQLALSIGRDGAL